MWTLVPDCLGLRRLPPQPHCAALETYFTPLCLCFCVYQMVVIIPTLQCFCENERMHTCLWRTVLSQFHSFSEEGISLNAPDWDFGGDRAVKPRSSLSLYPGSSCPQNTQLPLCSIHLHSENPTVNQLMAGCKTRFRNWVCGRPPLPRCLIMASLAVEVILGLPSNLFCFLSHLVQSLARKHQHQVCSSHRAWHRTSTHSTGIVTIIIFVLLKIACHTSIKINSTTQVPSLQH